MNAKQSLKLATQRIAELEDWNRRAKQDIQDYIKCICTMIEGGSPCQWCEEYEECQLQAKGGKGCTEWWLAYRKGDETHDSKAVLSEGKSSGAGAPDPASEAPAL